MGEALAVGLNSEKTFLVTEAMSPPHLPMVLSTAQMISKMEHTCLYAAQPHLRQDQTTVGTRVDMSHVGTAWTGEEFTVRIRLAKITGQRLLSFEIEVIAPGGVISTGRHQRLVVDKAPFFQRSSS